MTSLGILTWRQSANSTDMDRFCQVAVAGNRSPWAAQNAYGAALLDQTRLDEASEP